MAVENRKFFQPAKRSRRLRYGAAIAIVFISTLLRAWFHDYLESLVFFTYFPAVVAAGWFGGFGPGFCATLLSALAVNYFWMAPYWAFSLESKWLVPTIFFIICGAMISGLNEMLHRALRKERTARREFEVTLTSIGDGVITTNEFGRVTFLNPVAVALTGWTTAEAFGRPFEEVFRIISEQTRKAAVNPLEKVFKEKRVVGLANHTLLISKTGGEVPIEDSAAPIQDESGTVRGAVLVFQDASGRRKAEEMNSRLAAVVGSTDDAIITETPEGVITSWNLGAEKMYGYSASEVVGKSVTLLLPADRITEEQLFLDKLKRGERVEHYETVRIRKNGEPVTVSLALSALTDGYGTMVGAAKIARDISVEKKTEEALRERTKRLEMACAVANLGVFARGLGSDAPTWENEQIYRIFGLDPTDPPLTREVFIREFLHPDEVGRFEETLDFALRHGTSFKESFRIRRKSDGSERVIQYLAQVEQSATGEPRMFGIVADVTEQRAATEQLERMVSERTLSLQETVKQLEEFSYSVSHDLRSPLRTMQGYASALLEDYGGTLPDEAKHYLQSIKAAALRMDRLTQDVLAYSRLNHEKGAAHPINLHALIESVIEQYPNLNAQRPNIIVTPPLPYVKANEALLTQAIANLLGNAIKFTRKDVAPRVRLHSEQNNGTVRLWIEDNGIGIDPKNGKRIFEIFEQIHPRGTYDGTGIGLAIVRRAVERCGGRVGVESDGATGSRFWMELPAA